MRSRHILDNFQVTPARLISLLRLLFRRQVVRLLHEPVEEGLIVLAHLMRFVGIGCGVVGLVAGGPERDCLHHLASGCRV